MRERAFVSYGWNILEGGGRRCVKLGGVAMRSVMPSPPPTFPHDQDHLEAEGREQVTHDGESKEISHPPPDPSVEEREEGRGGG